MSRYKPRPAEQYMQAVERELADVDELERAYAETLDFDRGALLASIRTDTRAQLAQAAATLRLAEAQEHTNEMLNQLGNLIGLHPVLSHVMATQNMVLERDAVIAAQAEEIATLRVAATAAEDPDAKPN